MTRVTALAASSTAEKYRNRNGNQQTSVDFDGRITTRQMGVFKRQCVVSSRWHAKGPRFESLSSITPWCGVVPKCLGSVGTPCAGSRRPRGPLAPPTRDGAAALPRSWPLTPGRLARRQRHGAAETPRKSRSRGGFDKGTLAPTPHRALRAGEKPARFAHKLTGHRPLSNPLLH
jgi:hypothetical protein